MMLRIIFLMVVDNQTVSVFHREGQEISKDFPLPGEKSTFVDLHSETKTVILCQLKLNTF